MFSRLITIFENIKKRYELRKYSDFTIAEYFRSQGAVIGEDTRIMIRSLDEPYLVRIGNHCSISSGVRLITHDGGGWVFSYEIPSIHSFGLIEIKDNSYIGMNCIVLPGVTIGPNSIVGAGSVVTKDVPPNTVVAGNPARVIKSIYEYKEKLVNIWEEQKPPGFLDALHDGSSYSAEEIHREKNRRENLDMLKKHLMKVFSSKAGKND